MQCTSVARGVLDVFTLDCVNYGRFSLDGSVFGFIDEFVANVLCSLLVWRVCCTLKNTRVSIQKRLRVNIQNVPVTRAH